MLPHQLRRRWKLVTSLLVAGMLILAVEVLDIHIPSIHPVYKPSGPFKDICFLNVKDAAECKEICHYDTMCFYSYYYPSRKTANCFTQLFYEDKQPECQPHDTNGAIRQSKPENLVDKYLEPYAVNTSTCLKPNYHPFDPSLHDFMHRAKLTSPYWCRLGNRVSRFQINSRARDEISLKHPEKDCRFRYIYRDDSYKATDTEFSVTDWLPLTEKPTELTDEFVEVNCGANGNPEYQDYSSHVPKALAKRKTKEVAKRERTNVKSRRFPEDKLSVLIVTIDSVSLSHGYRHLPRTLGYLRQEMGSITFKGYNRVGQNSFPNAYPILAGIPAPIGQESAKHRDRFYDDDPLLFKWFKNDSFVTAFYEDHVDGGVFNASGLRKGFHYKPTDHYHKPFAVAVENSVVRFPAFYDDNCYLNKGIHVWLGDWLSSFVKQYSAINQPYFLFSWTSRISHDAPNLLGSGDQYYFKLFKDLHESNALNNTVVVLYADHGYRFGDLKAAQIRQHEANSPMMHWVFPEWFKKKYPHEMETFRANANNRLTSHFDLHRTLLDFVDGGLESATAAGMAKVGKSFFEPIEENRTCADAGIPERFCNCQITVPFPIEDEFTQIAAQAVVDWVNGITDALRDQCLKYTLKDIEAVYKHQRQNNDNMDLVELSVTVQLTPSKAKFMATVYIREPSSTNRYAEVLGANRMDSYGKTADCVKDSYLRLFCSCIDFTPH